MIKIHKSFVLTACVLAVSGYGRLFLILLISLTFHELAHMVSAKYFGGKVMAVHVTALGEAAVIKGLDGLSSWKRYIIYLSGPCVNLIIAGILYLLGWDEIALYNCILGLFNLLPVFPLDGGRLLQLMLGNRLGILRANRIILKMGRLVGLLLLIPGCIQVVLFPYNISLICAGIFIRRKNKKMILILTYEFFDFISRKKLGEIYPIKIYAAHEGAALQGIIERIRWNNMLCVRVNKKEIYESEIVDYVLTNGLTGTAGGLL